jgi:predicted molibdopterin-dependent oxidoreductase YjgC
MGIKVRIRINNVEVEAEKGESLLGVARRAGFVIPSLCYHEAVPSIGACRVCLVEATVGGRSAVTTSCNFLVQEPVEVKTETAEVRRHRALNLELLLARAPGSAALRALAAEHGVAGNRFGPPADAGAGIADCILCELCVRACDALGHRALAAVGRGERKRIGPPFGKPAEGCTACGSCAWICPTQAISMEDQTVARFKERWGAERPCRHALLGLLPGTVCENDYRCARCAVDQHMIDRAGGRHPFHLALARREVAP